MDQIRLLTARRAYEFRPDDLRVSILTTPAVRTKIQEAFNFQGVAVGTPISTFGPTELPSTGLVFNTGAFETDKDELIPIRFIHIEPTRIVIDVAAPSRAIDQIYKALLASLRDLRLPDDSPAVGTEWQRREYTEISAHFGFHIDAVFAAGVFDLLARGAVPVQDSKMAVAIPNVYVQKGTSGAPYEGGPSITDSTLLRFAPRQGFPLEERVYFSAAPLDSESHLTYLQDLERLLVGPTSGRLRMRRGKSARKLRAN